VHGQSAIVNYDSIYRASSSLCKSSSRRKKQ